MESYPLSSETSPILPTTVEPSRERFTTFLHESGNVAFRRSLLTITSVFFLLIIYPGISLLGMGDEPMALLKNLNEGTLLLLLVSTVAFQWVIFLLNFASTYREQTGLGGIGFVRFRRVDILWGIAFLLAANLILSGLAWLLGVIGMPLSGEVGLLIPKDPLGKGIWVLVAMTAGICEETAFRGYLMTRLRLLGRLNSWLIPTILSAIAFGACHAYQGLPGFIAITVYGVLFSLLYIRTGTIWPCIIAHFLQDFGALFFPH